MRSPHVGIQSRRELPIGQVSDSDRPYLSTADVADIVGVSRDTLEKWRARGYGPPWYRLPGQRRGSDGRTARRIVPRYKRSDVNDWIESCRVEAGGMPPGARKEPR